MDQLPFPKVARDARDTSRIAAVLAWPAAPTQRERVLGLVQHATWIGWGDDFGITDEQIQNELGMNPSTERPRRLELEEQGLIFDSGEKRKTRSGRPAIVWRAS
jgi:hypothetical protein